MIRGYKKSNISILTLIFVAISIAAACCIGIYGVVLHSKNEASKTNANLQYKIEYYFEDAQSGSFFVDEDLTQTGTGKLNQEIVAQTTTTKPGYYFDQTNGKNVVSGKIDNTNIVNLKVYFKLKTYTITFMNEGKLFDTISVKHGQTINQQNVPTKHSNDAKIAYVFDGWDKSFPPSANQDMTFNAVFSEKLVAFNINFYLDPQRTNLFEQIQVEYGKTLTPPTSIPTKDSSVQYNYTFRAWNQPLPTGPITSDMNFYALFDQTLRQYTYTFKNGSTIIKQITADYGSEIVEPDAPTKESSSTASYTFKGWDQAIPDSLTSDITFNAVFEQTTIKFTYTFYADEENTVILKSETVDAGSQITPPNQTPTKEDTAQYDYEFDSWNGYTQGMTITSNISFTPLFTQTLQQYTYRFWVDDDVYFEGTIEYGQQIPLPGTDPTPQDENLQFSGWQHYTPGMTITADVDFYATFEDIYVDLGFEYDIETYASTNGLIITYFTTTARSFTINDQYEIGGIVYNVVQIGNGTSSVMRYNDDLESISCNAELVLADRCFYDWGSTKTDMGFYKNVSFPNATSIETQAFANCTYLNFSNMPNVAQMGDGAFLGCEGLYEVKMPLLESIPDDAFNGCSRLSCIEFNSAQSIGARAFYGCGDIFMSSLPNVTDIGESAFEQSSGWTGPETPYLKSIGKRAFAYSNIRKANFQNVTSIGDEAFNNCLSLEEVDLPNLKEIAATAFRRCIRLNSLTFSEATNICANAFENCSGLKKILLPKATHIDDGAFSGCSGLDEVVMTNVTDIGNDAFSGCSSLSSLILTKAEKIGAGAFAGCNNVSILIPTSCYVDPNSGLHDSQIAYCE